MKKIDFKSLAAGIIIGTFGVSTVFAATGIRSAVLSNAKVTLNGAPLALEKPLVLVTMDDGQGAGLYAPANELLEKLGYTVTYDSAKDIVDLTFSSSSHQVVGGVISGEDAVINLANKDGQNSIAQSGSFQAEDNQTLTLSITSDIKGGSVELFLFAPDGREQRITIGSGDAVKEIALEKGVWQYNCFGAFAEGGNIKIIGSIK